MLTPWNEICNEGREPQLLHLRIPKGQGISAVYVIELTLGKVRCQRNRLGHTLVQWFAQQVMSNPTHELTVAAAHQSWPVGLSDPWPKDEKNKHGEQEKATLCNKSSWPQLHQGYCGNVMAAKTARPPQRPQRVTFFKRFKQTYRMHLKSGKKNHHLTDVPVKIFNLSKKYNKWYKLCTQPDDLRTGIICVYFSAVVRVFLLGQVSLPKHDLS